MTRQIDNIKRNIDWQFVTSAIVASVIIGGTVYAAKQAGFGTVAQVVKGG